MLVIGIAGGVASGKSLVAKQLETLGAVTVDADCIAHEVLEAAEVREAIGERWGEAVFDDAGRVDRGAIARRVFAPPPDGPTELEYLESLSHPRIRRLLEQRISELAVAKAPAAILDAAVMFKAGWDCLCDKIIFVEAPRPVRLSRALERGWTEEEFVRREASQTSLEKKRALSDLVLDNSGTAEALEAQVNQFWRDVAAAD